MGKTYLLDGQGAAFKNVIRFIGGKPLDGRAVVDTYSDIEGYAYKETFTNDDNGDKIASYYPGMLVVTKDTGKLYVLATDGYFKEVTPDLSKVLGSISVDYYINALEKAKADNVGQIIYVKYPSYKKDDGYTSNKLEADVDPNTGKVTEYSAAPYIVIDYQQLQKLEASTASGDISADLRQLSATVTAIHEAYIAADSTLSDRIDDINSIIGSDADGLVKDIADLKQADNDLDAKFADYTTTTFAAETYATIQNLGLLQELVNSINDNYLTTDNANKIYATIESVNTANTNISKNAEDISKLTTDISTVSQAVDALTNNVYNTEQADNAFNISVTSSTDKESGVKSYVISQGTATYSIDIPKDLMVKSGSVVNLTENEVGENTPAGTYIELILNTTDAEPIYINVADLIDEYEAAENGYIDVTNRKISIKYADLEAAIIGTADGKYVKAADFEGIKTNLTTTITTAYTNAIATAQQAAIDAAAASAESLYVAKKDYAVDKELLQNGINTVNGGLTTLGTTVSGINERLAATESTVTSLINTVSANTNAIDIINVTLVGSDSATGLVNIVNTHTIDIASIKEAANGTVKGIKLRTDKTVTADVNGIVTILTTDSLDDEDTSKIVTIAAVKDKINNKAEVIINASDPTDTLSNKNIYIIGNDATGYNGKILGEDGNLHILGAKTFVGKEEYASANTNGLMTSADYNLLHSITRIDDESLKGALV